jgi:DNA helicase-2/ATP-dependent DNA helicase PcrA
MPSRFIDELPPDSVEVAESQGGFGGYGGYGRSRFDTMESFGSNYSTPGWQRAQQRTNRGGFDDADIDYETIGPSAQKGERQPQSGTERARSERRRREPITIEGELVAKSTGTSAYSVGDRVFHQKFGYGDVVMVDGNKLLIQFDKAGEKRVVDSFVERV